MRKLRAVPNAFALQATRDMDPVQCFFVLCGPCGLTAHLPILLYMLNGNRVHSRQLLLDKHIQSAVHSSPLESTLSHYYRTFTKFKKWRPRLPQTSPNVQKRRSQTLKNASKLVTCLARRVNIVACASCGGSHMPLLCRLHGTYRCKHAHTPSPFRSTGTQYNVFWSCVDSPLTSLYY